MNRKGRPFLKKRYVLTRIRDILTRPFYWLYEKRLDSHIHEWQLPRHIALILDGNRRWARSVGLKELTKGHEVGAEKVREVLTWCYGLGIPTVSIWVFSTDNAKRDPQEVQRLMQLFEEKAREWIDDPMIHANEVRIRFMGRLQMLPENVRQAIRDVEAATAQYSRFQLNVAMAYG
ncbi:MAG: di-trans,poly-cis-decaprenylcistransferase, partial [Lentisphaerae bacterium]